jgi:hypothetical protein
MQTSQTVKEITAALLEFHKEVSSIPKTATNPFFKSKYADLSTILTTISTPLFKNGLVLSQFPEGESGLTTRIMHVSGEWMESTYIMKPVKGTPQDAGSAMTYQRRYAIGAILSLNIDEDDDGNKASQENKNGKSLHNHKELEKDGLPLISNTQFKKACDRIAAGELEIYYKVIADFSMEETQAKLLKQIYDKSKKQPA